MGKYRISACFFVVVGVFLLFLSFVFFFLTSTTLWYTPQVTLIKGDNSWRQGNNREIVAAHIIL